MVDVAIVGGGPVGLAAAIGAKRAGLSYVVLGKGLRGQRDLRLPDLHDVFHHRARAGDRQSSDGDGARQARPQGRADVLPSGGPARGPEYPAVHRGDGAFMQPRRASRWRSRPKTARRDVVEARRVVVATGYYDNPLHLGIPGEDSENVSHYYTEAHPVLGPECDRDRRGQQRCRRGPRFVARRGEGEHGRACPRAEKDHQILGAARSGKPHQGRQHRGVFRVAGAGNPAGRMCWCSVKDGSTFTLPTDYTFALTGYRPDLSFLDGLKLAAQPDECLVLTENYESSVPGLFVVGSAGFAGKTNQVFIENGRFHADHALAEIVRQLQGQEATVGV